MDCPSRADLATVTSQPHPDAVAQLIAFETIDAASKPPFEHLSADRIAAAFDAFKDIGIISSKVCLGILLRI